jgi:hypothetical protein
VNSQLEQYSPGSSFDVLTLTIGEVLMPEYNIITATIM